MVRFVNVLGSSGSVVPIFRNQIKDGGPVTVTDPNMTRYFMTIPEAAQLVIQAGAMAEGGEVFLLDMGEPVKIKYLAEQMVLLSGKKPGEDIQINYIGLRPGEKLYEELLVSGDVEGTDHRKIMRAQDGHLPWTELRGALNTLEQACDTFDYDAVKTFIEGLVEGASLETQLGDLTPRAAVVALNKAKTD